MSALDDAVNAAIDAKLAPALVNQATINAAQADTNAAQGTINASVNSRLQALEQPTPPPPAPGPRLPTGITYTDYIYDNWAGSNNTGSSNMTSNFAAFLATVPSGASPTQHSRIRFSQGGVYRFDTVALRLDGKNNLTLWGDGTGATIKNLGTGTTTANAGISVGFSGSGSQYIDVVNLTFEGNNQNAGTPSGYTGGNEHSHGILLARGQKHWRFYSVKTLKQWGHGVYLRSYSEYGYPTINDITFYDCDFGSCGVMGVAFAECEDVTLDNCTIHDQGWDGVNFEDGIAGTNYDRRIKVIGGSVSNWSWHPGADGSAVANASTCATLQDIELSGVKFLGGHKNSYNPSGRHIIRFHANSNAKGPIYIHDCDGSALTWAGAAIMAFNGVTLGPAPYTNKLIVKDNTFGGSRPLIGQATNCPDILKSGNTPAA